MDGSEDPLLVEEIARLEAVQTEVVNILADLVLRQATWQHLMTQRFREASQLRIVNDRLRDELRRYTASKFV